MGLNDTHTGVLALVFKFCDDRRLPLLDFKDLRAVLTHLADAPAEVQRDPRRKLIRFWRDRDDLMRTLREEVFTLDDEALVSQSLRDGAFVDVGSAFEQTWTIENTGFCVWEDRALQELASEHVVPERASVPVALTKPGEEVSVTVRFTWQPGRVDFSGSAETTGGTVALPSWTNTSADVPTTDTERVHMNLWLYQGRAPSNGQAVDLAITNFRFTP